MVSSVIKIVNIFTDFLGDGHKPGGIHLSFVKPEMKPASGAQVELINFPQQRISVNTGFIRKGMDDRNILGRGAIMEENHIVVLALHQS